MFGYQLQIIFFTGKRNIFLIVIVLVKIYRFAHFVICKFFFKSVTGSMVEYYNSVENLYKLII